MGAQHIDLIGDELDRDARDATGETSLDDVQPLQPDNPRLQGLARGNAFVDRAANGV